MNAAQKYLAFSAIMFSVVMVSIIFTVRASYMQVNTAEAHASITPPAPPVPPAPPAPKPIPYKPEPKPEVKPDPQPPVEPVKPVKPVETVKRVDPVKPVEQIVIKDPVEAVIASSAQTAKKIQIKLPHDNVIYWDDVKPIFEEHCTKCHADTRPKGQLDLTTYKNVMLGGSLQADGEVRAVEPGDSSKSAVYLSILLDEEAEDDDDKNPYYLSMMPPLKERKKGKVIPESDIKLIKDWIDQGARDEKTKITVTPGNAVKDPKSPNKIIITPGKGDPSVKYTPNKKPEDEPEPEKKTENTSRNTIPDVLLQNKKGEFSQQEIDQIVAFLRDDAPMIEKDGKMVYDQLSVKSYPESQKCAACHREHWEQWSISGHAYSNISPAHHKFEQAINNLAVGTINHFCQGCHNPIGTLLKQPRDLPLWERHKVELDGVGCVVCHRQKEQYTVINGDRRIEPGGICSPVYGPTGSANLLEVLKKPDDYSVTTDPKDPRPRILIHESAFKNPQMTHNQMCVQCHDVDVHPGVPLEIVGKQYRNSPAYKKGISCVDCHMSSHPTKIGDFKIGHAAVIAGRPIGKTRRLTNHEFWGPGQSIAHPGLFPHVYGNPFTTSEWLAFDYIAGWGTEKWEKAHKEGKAFPQYYTKEGKLVDGFPPEWADIEKRLQANSFLKQSYVKIGKKKWIRKTMMEHSLQIKGPFHQEGLLAFNKPVRPLRTHQVGETLKLYYNVTNSNEGHHTPSNSLGAQPQVWMNVVLVDPDGQRIWESGDGDKFGGLRTKWSSEVQNGTVAHDDQLWNLQTVFLYTGFKGPDREWFVPVNVSFGLNGVLPQARPGAQPTTLINGAPFVRMEIRALAPNETRPAKYSIPGHLFKKRGKYKLASRLRYRAEPISFMKWIGATPEMIMRLNQGMVDINPYTIEFRVD